MGTFCLRLWLDYQALSAQGCTESLLTSLVGLHGASTWLSYLLLGQFLCLWHMLCLAWQLHRSSLPALRPYMLKLHTLGLHMALQGTSNVNGVHAWECMGVVCLCMQVVLSGFSCVFVHQVLLLVANRCSHLPLVLMATCHKGHAPLATSTRSTIQGAGLQWTWWQLLNFSCPCPMPCDLRSNCGG